MNLAQCQSIEPDGAGTRYAVRYLARQMPEWKAIGVRRGTEPKLHSSVSKALWKVICHTAWPLTKREWLDRAGIKGSRNRTLGASAIFNLAKGNWVREDDGKYRRA